MSLTTVTQRSSFECCYLTTADSTIGKCLLNCHDYRVEATVYDPDFCASDMVISFKALKQLLDQCLPDHKFIYKKAEDWELYYDTHKLSKIISDAFRDNARSDMVLCVDFDISCESLANYIAILLDNKLQKYNGVRLKELRLKESNDSIATWSCDN